MEAKENELWKFPIQDLEKIFSREGAQVVKERSVPKLEAIINTTEAGE